MTNLTNPSEKQKNGIRTIASITGSDNACFYLRRRPTPSSLSSEGNVLSLSRLPLPVLIQRGNVPGTNLLLLIFLCALCASVCAKKLGWTWARSSIAGAALAIGLAIGYSYLIEVPMASASYTEGDIYYYTSDHIGRPFNLRDSNQTLTWYEHHYAFGDQIHEWSSSMPAGSGQYAITWKPNFRFPGQYEDSDMGLAYTSASLFVQNHYREYMPRFGSYNSDDPAIQYTQNGQSALLGFDYSLYHYYLINRHIILKYNYTSEPFNYYDFYALRSKCFDLDRCLAPT